jgi:CRISPR-associated endonuclease/helicase Cas3
MTTAADIWAKSSGRDGGRGVRLHEHIQDALAVFDKIFDKIKDRVDGPLCELIRLAIVCHDWGKVLPAFQIQRLKNTCYTPCSPLIDIPHSFFSLLWIDEDKLNQRLPEQDTRTYREFLLSAIAYHHWRESFFELISAPNADVTRLMVALSTVIDRLKANLQTEIRKLGDGWHELVGFNETMASGLRNGVPFSEYARPPYQLYFLPKRVGLDDKKMREWILIAGFLQRADHFASFCEEEGEHPSTAEAEICPMSFNDVVKEVQKRIQKSTQNSPVNSQDAAKIWQLDKINDYRDKHAILVAPTGYGKTEFAFLWGSGEKFFYTLPLRAAVNQIFERAKAIFGEQKVGLLHSDADVYLLGDGGEGQANLKAYDLARQLAYPALISTGDQFFPYALRPPGYEKIYATFSYSRLVIDEVQAYDPRAAAIVVKFIENVVRMGGKFLLMTATLPTFIEKEIDAIISHDHCKLLNLYCKEQRFKQIQKHRIKVELLENHADGEKIDFAIPDKTLEEVLKQACERKRVLVIANTVKQAQDIFERLKSLIEKDDHYKALKDKIWLLHSRFTQADRNKLEMEICGDRNRKINGEFQNPKPNSEQQGKILVATQVVEASLDIDADVLFTEVAPLDALVQRMGRILRRYGPASDLRDVSCPENPNIYIWVFQRGLQSGQHYVYDPDLVLLTIKLLKDRPDKHCKDWLSENLTKHPKLDDRTQSVLEEVFGCEEGSRREGRERSRKGKRKRPTDEQTPFSRPREFEFVCSEYDKYNLVDKLFESLSEETDYLRTFRQTKDILDAGYMSDRKEDAQKIFRDIHTLSVVPDHRREDFITAIENFFNSCENKRTSFTLFKKEVLSKFVVQVPFYAKQIQQREFKPVEWWVRDLSCVHGALKKVLMRWCQDIYFANYKYDERMGIIAEAPWGCQDVAIL